MRYQTDLTDTQWELIRPIFIRENNYTGLHLEKHDKRQLINAVKYLNKTGCHRRMLPNDFPPWRTVASFFYRARDNGQWEAMNDLLVRCARIKAGRTPEPSYGLVDSQSVKTTGAADERGFDGGKKSKRKKKTYRN